MKPSAIRAAVDAADATSVAARGLNCGAAAALALHGFATQLPLVT
jgi:hypothetical protein